MKKLFYLTGVFISLTLVTKLIRIRDGFFFLSLRVGKEFMGHLAQPTVFIRSKQHWGTVKSDFYEDCTVRYSRGWASNSDMLHALI